MWRYKSLFCSLVFFSVLFNIFICPLLSITEKSLNFYCKHLSRCIKLYSNKYNRQIANSKLYLIVYDHLFWWLFDEPAMVRSTCHKHQHRTNRRQTKTDANTHRANDQSKRKNEHKQIQRHTAGGIQRHRKTNLHYGNESNCYIKIIISALFLIKSSFLKW